MYIKKTKKGYNMGGAIHDQNYIAQYLADGGDVDPKKELAKLEADQKASAAKRKSDYQKDKEYLDKIGRYKDRVSAKKKWDSEYARLNGGVDQLQKEYEKILDREKNPDKRGIGESDERIVGQKKETLKKLQTLMEERDKAKHVYDFVADDKNYDLEGNIKSAKKAEVLNSDIKAVSKSGSELNNLEDTKPLTLGTSKTIPVKKAVENKAASNIQRTGSPWATSLAPTFVDDSGKEYPKVAGETKQTDLGNPIEPGILGTESDLNQTQAEILSKTATDELNKTPEKQPGQKTWKDQVKGVDWEMLGAGAQTVLGMDYLNKSGKRPTYQLDPEFIKQVDLATANASYGYTPIQRSILEQNSDALYKAGVTAARDYSGGSAGSAYNKTRLAINDQNKRNLEIAAMDEQLKQDKRSYADDMISRKASMKNMMFQDQLNAWSANQTAGGNLISSGIRNLINKSRLDKELAVQSQANNISNVN